jgi:hypothetical protein
MKSKFILSTLILLTIWGATLAKDPRTCDSLGKYTCATNQTCCRNKISPTGWACFPVNTGVCCSDGVSICPEKFICNLRDKKCDPQPTLSFLEELQENSTTVQEIYIDAKVNTSQATKEFANGFIKGFGFFSNLPYEKDCIVEDPQIYQDIADMVNIIKSISIKSDFSKIITEFFAKATDIYEKISKLSTQCANYANEIKHVVEGLKEYSKGFTYYGKLALHTAENIKEITGRIKSAVDAYSAGNFQESGNTFGESTKFVLFWSYQPQIANVFLAIDEIQKFSPTDIIDFLKIYK